MADVDAILGRELNSTSGLTFGGAIDIDLPPVPASGPIPGPAEAITLGRIITGFAGHVWRNVRGVIGSTLGLSWIVMGWILQVLTDITPILTELYFTDSMKAEFQPFNPYT